MQIKKRKLQFVRAKVIILEERKLTKLKKAATKSIIWFKDTEQPNKMDWLLYGIVAFTSYLFFMHCDFMIVTEQSMHLIACILKGTPLSFYQYSIENVSLTWPPSYELPIFIIFAVWNIPIYIINAIHPFDFIVSPMVNIYAKMLPLLFMFGTMRVLYLVCKELKCTDKQAKWCMFFFCSAIPTLVSTVWIAQVDIISVFFIMIGFYYYIKKNTFRFCLFFAIAIPMKLFALFIFFPLLLFIEKKVFKCIGYTLSSLSILLLCKMLFWGDQAYMVSKKEFGLVNFQRMTTVSFPGGMGGIPIFMCVFVLICIYCYLKRFENDTQLFQYSIYVSLMTYYLFLIFVQQPYLYWNILVAPFIALIIVTNKKQTKINLILDTMGWLFFAFLSLYIQRYFYDLYYVFKPIKNAIGAPESIRAYSSPGELIMAHSWERYWAILYALFVACAVGFLVINRPSRNKEEKDMLEVKVDRSIVWIRIFSFVPCIILTFYCLFPIAPISILDNRIEYTPSSQELLIEGALFQQDVMFESAYELQELEVVFAVDDVIPINRYSSVDFEFIAQENKETLLSIKIPANTLPQGENAYFIKLNNIKVEPNRKYSIVFTGGNSLGETVRLGLTSHISLPYQMTINGEVSDNNLYFNLWAKNVDKIVPQE